MFKAVRVSISLLILAFVAIGTWLAQAHSPDWSYSLPVRGQPPTVDAGASRRHAGANNVVIAREIRLLDQ